MMSRLRRIITLALGVVFGAAILSYSFCHRFSPEKVSAIIPRELSTRYQAASWSELKEERSVQEILAADPNMGSLLNAIDREFVSLDSDMVLVPIPRSQWMASAHAWVAASWVGGRCPWLRWKMEQARDKNLEPIKNETVWPVWECHSLDLPEGMGLYFALTENLFVVCLSETPMDMVLILNRFDQAGKN